MNNRPSEDPKVLLIYGYTNGELDSLISFLNMHNHEYILVSSEQTGLTLEELITQKSVQQDPVPIPLQRTIVISGYSQQELHMFLQNLKTLNVHRPIMATVTPTSKKWAFGNLVKELMLEHAQMSKQHPSLKKNN